LVNIIDTASYEFCSAVYLILAALVVFTKAGMMRRRTIVVACLATGLWAALVAASNIIAVPHLLLNLAEVTRSGGWLYFLLGLWGRLEDSQGTSARRNLVTRASIPVAIVILVVILPYYATGSTALGSIHAIISLINIVIPVVGLLLIENLLRTSGEGGRWAIKHLCLGLGAMMTFDFFLYSDGLVQGSIDQGFLSARGLITALVAPLIFSSFQRLQTWQRQVEVKVNGSAKASYYTVALVASGAYLLVMGAAAYYIRTVGGTWGAPLQVTFMVAALLLMLASLTSSQIKSHVKTFVLKNFFAYRYDYREEWLRFIQIMSTDQPSALGPRLIRAMADLMDSPASALWVLQSQDDCFFADAVWNLSAPHPSVRADSPLIQFLRRTCRVIDIDEYRATPNLYDGLTLPGWIADRPAVWLIVPLIHRGEVHGFVILDQARASRRLDWEDRALLNTTAIQAASYLAEELTAEALRAARRLEDFNRQFAFVVHDLKNIVGQMSLMLENAKTFGDNPDFQKDMLGTVGNSVGRMRSMLEQLASQRRQPATPQLLELATILGGVADHWALNSANLTLDLPPDPAHAIAVEATLIAVLNLLIDNALSAVGPAGTVILRLRVDGDRAIIEVSDNGPGMDEAFVNKELFRLLASTKSSGYGIGAYQTRYLVREMGAQLEVESAPQRGTTMRIVMSLALPPMSASDAGCALQQRQG
jgi:putative PEP-CTERM system histidine kinase